MGHRRHSSLKLILGSLGHCWRSEFNKWVDWKGNSQTGNCFTINPLHNIWLVIYLFILQNFSKGYLQKLNIHTFIDIKHFFCTVLKISYLKENILNCGNNYLSLLQSLSLVYAVFHRSYYLHLDRTPQHSKMSLLFCGWMRKKWSSIFKMRIHCMGSNKITIIIQLYTMLNWCQA